MGEGFELLAHCLDDTRVIVTYVEHTDATNEVEVFLALVIPQICTRSPADGNRVGYRYAVGDVLSAG
ncbi:hypothetical protein D3C77_790060 [compost metagenome]